MNLDELRIEIDKLDKTILSSFEKRMDLCHQVADYKKANGLPVFQADREKAIIEKVRANSPEGLEDASAVLFTEIMDISKSLQQSDIYRSTETAAPSPFTVSSDQLIGCQGTVGSNSEAAARKLFKDNKITFYDDFEQVFKAVCNGEITYGILPIHNSTAGSVTQTYDLMRKYDVFITKLIRTEIHHCLAAKPGNTIDNIQNVYSHPQALSQCSAFLHENILRPIEALNTATAAKFVSTTDEKCGAICSESAAELYGLEILQKNISNVVPNYTQFICISRQFLVSDDADTISVNLKLPHSAGSLYRLLSKFFISSMNLTKIESRPLLDGSFDVMFYLDFTGSISDIKVRTLLSELACELEYFKFMGNYSEI